MAPDEPRLEAVAAVVEARGGPTLCPSPTVAAGLGQRGVAVVRGAVHEQPDAALDGVVLADGELATAEAEALIRDTARVLRPGGIVVAAARNPLLATSGPAHGPDAEGLTRILGQAGFTVERRCAPGATERLAGASTPGYRHRSDQRPGLLDAADWSVVVGRAPAGHDEREAAFLRHLPRKVVAAAVVCRDEAGRLLTVYDTFKQHWTIPGGVVDADEDPGTAARRETWEEAGVEVTIGPLLGVFCVAQPDRLVLCYQASCHDGASPSPAPNHAHEIAAAEWTDLDTALDRLDPRIRAQVARCLSDPGATWPQELP